MNSTGGAIVADTRAHIATLAAELKTLHSSIFQCPSAELGVFLAELAEIRALAGAASVIVAADAETRGAVEASQSASTRGWVAEHGWHSRREASTIAKAAHILRRPDLAEIADSIRTADLDLTTAVVVQGEYDKLVPELLPDAPPIVLKHLVNHGAEYGPRGVRESRQWILAHDGKPDEFANFQERCRRHISLSSPTETSTGLHEYRLVVDNEGLSILEAAIQTLAAPRPDADTDERDNRPTDRRRGEAVIEALRRSVLAQGQGVTAAPTAIVHVTMNLDDLQQRTGAGTCTGTIADGTLLAPTPPARSPATPESSPPSSDPTAPSSTAAQRNGCSPSPRNACCGSGTGTAPSPAATSQPTGQTPTTWCTGSTADPPTSTTQPCSARPTTPSSTATN